MEPFFRGNHTEIILEPPASTPIWKYLDLAKFLALLRYRRLHLAPTTEFPDRFEGDIGAIQKKQIIERYGQEKHDELVQFLQSLRERTYVSCWTENEFESDAMWKIYTGASYGVAIQTTYERLKSVLPEVDESLICTCGRVNYVDFKTEVLGLESYCIPYFYKRKSFEHEREVRVLVQDIASIKKNASEGAGTTDCSRLIELSKGQLDQLIESLRLSPGAPGWFHTLVRDVCCDYGLMRDPIPSDLDEVPE